MPASIRGRWKALVGFVLLVLALPLPTAGAQPMAAQPAGAPSKVAYIIQERLNRIDAALSTAGPQRRLSAQATASLSDSLLRVSRSGEILLEFHGTGPVGAVEEADLTRRGARIEISTGRMAWPRGVQPPANLGLVEAWMPYNQVLAAAQQLPWVAAVTPVEQSPPDVGPNLSEGVALHNADDVQAAGIDGAGVTVGVISDGVSNLAASQALGDLPAGVTVLGTGSGDEGTAMLEIIHDMAPGAALIFDATGGGTAAHIAAQNALVAAGADVIAEDIPFDGEPAFQRGAVAVNGDAIAAAGVSMHSSAGNLGQRHAARVTATGTGAGPDGLSGPFTSCTTNPTNVVAIAPNGDTTFDVRLRASNVFTLQWSEPRAIAPTAGAGGFTNLDLYVMNAAGTTCLGQSLGVQANGAGDTIEQISLTATTGTVAKIVVNVAGGGGAVAAPIIDLRWRGADPIDTAQRSGSLNPDSNYTGLATTSAAVDAAASSDLATVALEPYSAGGPVQLFSTTVCPGAYPCPGGSVAGAAATTASAPTWSAADDVDVSGVGGFGSPFSGTSAAAPHAAACEALLRDHVGGTPAVSQMRARLAATAVDRGPSGTDNAWGAGVLDCRRAILPTASAGGPYVTPEGTDVVLNGAGSSDPDGDLLTYAWDFDADGAFDDATGSAPTFNLVGQDGVFPIALRVTDPSGLTADATSVVTVNNVAPTLAITPGTLNEGAAGTLTGMVTDPGWLDPLSATIDWGDGTPPEPIAGTLENTRPNATLTFSSTRLFGDDASFSASICVADDDTNSCTPLALTINNITPTVEISRSATVPVNGVPTFLLRAHEDLHFYARTQDPGSDDLSLSWDWDDSGRSPDRTTLDLVNPPNPDPLPSPSVQPRDVTDRMGHDIDDPCVYTVTFTAADDDGGVGVDEAPIVVQGRATRTLGYSSWRRQFRDVEHADFSEQRLACFLKIATYMSRVFDEARDASTADAAYAVLTLPSHPSARDQFDRQLLAVWLNFANGSIAYDELVDTDGRHGVDTPFAEVIAAAETVRLDPLATDAQIKAQKKILDRIKH
jgi:hypothetical protein